MYLPGGVLLGVGAAAVIVGAVLVPLAQAKESDVDDRCGGPERLTCPLADKTDIEDELSQSGTFETRLIAEAKMAPAHPLGPPASPPRPPPPPRRSTGSGDRVVAVVPDPATALLSAVAEPEPVPLFSDVATAPPAPPPSTPRPAPPRPPARSKPGTLAGVDLEAFAKPPEDPTPSAAPRPRRAGKVVLLLGLLALGAVIGASMLSGLPYPVPTSPTEARQVWERVRARVLGETTAAPERTEAAEPPPAPVLDAPEPAAPPTATVDEAPAASASPLIDPSADPSASATADTSAPPTTSASAPRAPPPRIPPRQPPRRPPPKKSGPRDMPRGI